MTYIDPRSKVLRHVDRLVDWRRGRTPAPVTIEWDLSNRCVLGCQDCHFAHTHTRGPWTTRDRRLPMAFEVPGDLADSVLVRRALREASDAGVQGVIWTGGGEPTTHPDWTGIVAYASSLGLQQGMYTLGGLLTRETATHLARHAAWVVVSLDACDADSYAGEKGVPESRFDAAVAGIRWLAEAKSAVIGVSFLLHQWNWRRAPAMLAFARWLNATYATFRPAIQTSPDQPSVCTSDRGWIPEAVPTLRRLAENVDVEIDVARFEQYAHWTGHGYQACLGIRLNTTITPDGRVWVCLQRRGFSGSCLGDLRQESFAQIWGRHPGRWTVDANCRVMCRLHPVNQQIEALEQSHVHEAFV